MSLPLQSKIKIVITREKCPYLWLAFIILMCIPGFGVVYINTVLYEIHISELMKIASDLIPDRLYMNVDSGSNGGDDVPGLSSGTSDVSDMDHEQSHQHQDLQDQLERRAEEHQRQFEEQARVEDLEGQNRQLDEQASELEERARQLEEQARLDEVLAQQERELANRLDAESRQADEQARQLEEQARQLRESISRNIEEIRDIQERQANV